MPAKTPDIAAMIAAAVENALAGMLPGAPDAPAPVKATPRGRKATAKPKIATPKLPVGCITAGIAWELLGGDDKYEPKNPARMATNFQLWKLNEAGLLRVA